MGDEHYKVRFRANLLRESVVSFGLSFLFGTLDSPDVILIAIVSWIMSSLVWIVYNVHRCSELSRRLECRPLCDILLKKSLIDSAGIGIIIPASLVSKYLNQNYVVLAILAIVWALASAKILSNINYPYEWASSERIRQARKKCF
ncbi:hypothetical protein E3E35_07210 [Thermococcus sp. GR7]|uniref:hypothetical protein n=1 Tax=unclassified Thermococcus TaxID=2627626 RepID=UPI0014314FFF|nr:MULTISPECIES: hypothetical protein [unclassified Thermococcus]NJE47192.1 hypothetical protein [Thermococcus sp. GR7]NJE77983.1 hypothetical protein [Thermococcus sp. GR4]NJF22900.1 hypothetical protein [Thermococcus sp. GR5]